MGMEERVLVIDSVDAERLCNGKSGIVDISLEKFLNVVRKGRFVERKIAEYDESTKQVIPYIVLKEDDEYIFFKRTNKSNGAKVA